MSLLNFIKPKWQHTDPLVRLDVIESDECPDKKTLGDLIQTETDLTVRSAALARIEDWGFLLELSAGLNDSACVDEINLRVDALKVEAVLNADQLSEKEQALSAITDDVLLLKVAANDSNKDLRLLAAEKISLESVLTELVAQNCGKDVSIKAVDRIHDPELLSIVSKTATNRAARGIATKKLNKLSDDKAALENDFFEEKTSSFIERIKVLPMLSDVEGAYQQSLEIQKEWNDISVPDNFPANELFVGYVQEIKERYDTYLSQSDVERQKLAKLPGLLEKLSVIDSEIIQESESLSSSAHQTFENLMNQWHEVAKTLDELPKQVQKRFNQSCRQFEDKQALIQQEKNCFDKFKDSLIDLQDNIDNKKPKISKDKLIALKTEINEWGPKFIEKTELVNISVNIENTISSLIENLNKEKNDKIQDSIDCRKSLLSEMENIIGSDNIQSAEKKFNELKKQWTKKDSTPVDELKSLNNRYDQICSEYTQYLTDSYENRDWQFWQNKNLKTNLIEEMRLLALENDIHVVFKKMKVLQEKWKESGSVQHKENDKLWKRFQSASESNFARCKEFFNELDAQAEENALKKQELIEIAKSYQESSEWGKTTQALKDLQKQWKDIGKAPAKSEHGLYKSFRKVCDVFFNRRKDHYDQLDVQRKENLLQKEELCAKLEKLVAKPDLSKNDKVRDLQKEWKKIGHVPREDEDTIWQRFRAANDIHYSWLDTLKPDNLKKKEKLCDEVEILCKDLPDFSDEKKTQEFSKQRIEIQKFWKKIGPVPDDQQEEIWQRFRASCDQFFNQRNIFNASIDKKRPENESLKVAIINQLELAIKTNNKDSVKEIIKLQHDWKKIGPASKKNDFPLERQFESLCNGFFKGRREVFNEMDRIRRENLKQKEALCVRLEILAGISVPKQQTSGAGKNSLTLAEQLKLAFEENFIIAGDDSNKSRRKKDELAVIIDEWKQIGPVPKEHEFSLKKRYNKSTSKLTKEK